MLRLVLALCLAGCTAAPVPLPGDLVFQTSRSAQSEIIAEVTGSPWTHVGVVFERRGERWVLEAVQPVRWTRFDRWRARGEGERYLVRRVPRSLTAREVRALRRGGKRYLGRRYDARFEWSDRRMYCSELVWKMYERALGVRLTEPERWTALSLSPPSRSHAAASAACLGASSSRPPRSPRHRRSSPSIDTPAPHLCALRARRGLRHAPPAPPRPGSRRDRCRAVSARAAWS